LPPNIRVAQRNMFRRQNSTIRGETNDKDHDVLMETFTEKSRIQEYMFAPCAKWYSWFTCHVNGTRHSYELQRSDGGPKYEIWLWVMKSYIAWVNGIFTTIDPNGYQYRDFLKSCIWRSVVIGTTRRFWKTYGY
jgi:uncharacterized CHY-type Zn-finger protein